MLRHRLTSLSSLLLAAVLPAQTARTLSDLATAVRREFGLRNGLVVQVAVQRTAGGFIAATDAGLLLRLTAHSLRAPGYRLLAASDDGVVAVPPGPSRTVRGTVLGVGDSAVAGSLLERGLYARIRIGSADYWIEPTSGRLAGAPRGTHVLYQTADVIRGVHSCRLLATSAPHAAPDRSGGAAPAAAKVAELACDADYEYFQDYGSVAAVEARIESVIGTMNLQYESQLDLTHRITTILVRTSASQPYTSTDAGTLLNQFRSDWNTNHGGVQRDVAHLFTGKELNGTTIGVAWRGVVCNLSLAYGLVQSDYNNNFSCATDLSAHELGHNWNADHCQCSSYTMNSFITCANQFHPKLSVREMRRFANRLSCLDSGGGGTPTKVHVESIVVSTPGAGKGQKRGRAAVTILDDVGSPVAGATVTGAFSGSINEPASGTTGSDGTVTFNSTATAKGKLAVTFCVTGVAASLPYDPAANKETCDTN